MKLAPDLALRLLEELIYERVSRHVDILELTWLESDLDDAIRRALEELDEDGRDDPPSAVLAQSLIERAWTRVEQEWRDHRGALTEDCALCELDRRVREEIQREAHR